MSVEVCNYNYRSAFSAHRVMKTHNGGKKITPLNKALRELVVRKLFAQLEDREDSLISFEDIMVVAKGSESSTSACTDCASAQEAFADPNPSEDPQAASVVPCSDVSSSSELEEEIDEDFVYFGSRDGEIEDDSDYGLWDACHDIADEYEEKFFRGRKNSRRTLNQTLRHKQANKRERTNPERRVKNFDLKKREKRDSNVQYHNEIQKSKSSRKYSHLIPIPPWMVQSDNAYVASGAFNGRLNPQSRVEEERQLSLAIQQSLQSARPSRPSHPSGLSMQQILELTTRELTPEDYELLLLLDDSVQKKTISKSDFRNKFTHCTMSCDGPADEPCIVCFNSFLKGEKQTELPCSHKYHSHCIEQWLTQSGTKCPLCGVNLDN